MDLGIRGRHALVCGGSKGLGKAAAMALAGEGADLTLVARTAGPLEAAAAEGAAALFEGDGVLTFDPAFALDYLRDADPVLGRLIDTVGPFRLQIRRAPSIFIALAEAIVYQQLHAKAAASAIAELRAAWPELKNQRSVQALYGSIQHEDFLRSGDLSTAEKANKHYLVALDLVRSNVRYRAMILGALGVLHTQVGNFHIALGYLDEREKLPYVESGSGLAVRLARARALLHVGREAEAAQVADQAVAMVDIASHIAIIDIGCIGRRAIRIVVLAMSAQSRQIAVCIASRPGIAAHMVHACSQALHASTHFCIAAMSMPAGMVPGIEPIIDMRSIRPRPS